MGQKEIERRIVALEFRLVELESSMNKEQGFKDWQSTRGCFTGDEVMKRIFENGNKIREADRRKARATRKRGQRVNG